VSLARNRQHALNRPSRRNTSFGPGAEASSQIDGCGGGAQGSEGVLDRTSSCWGDQSADGVQREGPRDAGSAPERDGTALAAVDWFLERTIDNRSELVLSLHGGPTELPSETQAVRARLHSVIGELLERGRHDRSIQPDVTTRDVVTFGAMLAQPLSSVPDWDAIAQRQKQLFLRGISGRLMDE
jgi:hypothetical protein